MKKVVLLITVLLMATLAFSEKKIAWADDVYGKARDLLAAGNYAEAEEIYKKLLKDFPTSEILPFAKTELAVCNYYQKRYDEAINILETLIKEKKGYELTFLALADCYNIQKKYNKVLEVYKNGLKQMPSSSRSLRMALANYYFERKDYANAKALIKVINDQPLQDNTALEADLLLAKIYNEEKNPSGAEAIFAKRMRDLEKNAQNPESFYQTAEYLFNSKNYQRAVDFYKKVPSQEMIIKSIQDKVEEYRDKVKKIELSRAPNMEKPILSWKNKELEQTKLLENAKKSTKDLSIQSLYKIGQCLLNLKDYNGARKAFETYLKKNPKGENAKDAAYFTSVSFLLEGKNEEFLNSSKSFISTSADDATADILRLGMLETLLKEKKYKEILAEYGAGTLKFKSKATMSEGCYKVGLAYYALEDYGNAVNLLNTAVEKYEEGGTHLGWTYFYLGNAYYNMNKFDEAVSVYLNILEKYKTEEYYKNALYQIGFANGKIGQYVKALEYLNLFMEKYPKDEMSGNVIMTITDIYMFQEKHEEALTTCRKYIIESPQGKNAPRFMAQMGALYFKQGKEKEMVRQYSSLLKEYPESEYCAEALYWLGWASFKAGKIAEGFKYFQDARYWRDTATGKSIQFKIGEYLFSEKEYVRAEAEYLQLAAESSESEILDTVMDRLGEIYYITKKLDGGLQTLSELAEKRKNNENVVIKIKLAMVNILFRQKAVEPALKLWREISAKMPNLTANSYYVVASNLDQIGNTKGAAELYNMAIEKYKDDVVLPYCYARLVYFRMQAGEDVKAVYEFVKGPLQKFKGMDGLPEISLLLGEYNYQNDKIEEALKYYKKSLSISKGQIGVETRFKLAGCYFKLNKYKEALSVYVQVAFVYSSNKILAEEALFKAGRCAELAGNNADAAKYYKKYFEMYPAGRFKTEVESRNKNIKGGR